MKKEDKVALIEQLKTVVSEYSHLYLADIGGLNSEQSSALRRQCFKNDVKLMVVKNTLFKKALESSETDYSQLFESLAGETSIMLSNTGNAPAKVIKEFSKKEGNGKPVLKAAYVEESFYTSDQLEALVAIKSKNELIADVISLLQSPAKNIVSALQSSGNKLSGVLTTLSEKK